MKLFCFPYAGGNRYSFNIFKPLVPDNLSLIFLDYPGHGMRMQEALQTDMHAIADDIIQHHGAQFNGEFAFYGHSMGCLVAHLVCRKLQQAGRRLPGMLVLTGCGAPSAKERFKNRHLMPYADFIITLRELGGIPEELLNDKDSMKFFEPILRADFEAVDTYRYQLADPFNIPMTIITGTEEDLTPAEISAWQDETGAHCSFAQMPGGHFFIQQDPARVMRAIVAALNIAHSRQAVP